MKEKGACAHDVNAFLMALCAPTHMRTTHNAGFTLIELSIVLVIIGLIVGGVLVGRDLIAAAEVRATITQMTKYQTAVNVFRDKYEAIPGDLDANTATRFGFAPRGGNRGEGDGSGVIEAGGGDYNSTLVGAGQATGETAMFWVDLSTAGLIDGSFNTASSTIVPTGTISGSALSLYLPQAKLGKGNYIFVWSGKMAGGFMSTVTTGFNYFGITGLTAIANVGGGFNGIMSGQPALSVQQAFSLDKKMDDGLPQSGKVLAVTVSGLVFWADSDNGPGDGTATPPSPTTCYDDGGNTGSTRQYSMSQRNGSGMNCALSFPFQ